MELSLKERFSCPGRKSPSAASLFFPTTLGVFAPVLLLEAFLVFPHVRAAIHCISKMKQKFGGAWRGGVKQGSGGAQSFAAAMLHQAVA